MALVKCKYCENEISDKATKCPHCKKRVKGKIIIPIIIVIATLIIAVAGITVYMNVKRIEEEKRQEQIVALNEKVEISYAEMDFETVAICYDELEKLGCDMTIEREILEYDIEMAPVALEYYNAIVSADKKLLNYSYSSLKQMLTKLKVPTQAILDAEINENSKIGIYIRDVRANIMFQGFNELYIWGDTETIDAPLTQDAHAMIMQTYTECILDVEFPYE